VNGSLEKLNQGKIITTIQIIQTMIPQTKRRIAKAIIILLVFLSLILALTILGQPGFSDNKISKNQTTEPLVVKEPTENSGNPVRSTTENVNQQGFDILAQSLHIYPNTWEERKNVTNDLPDTLKKEIDKLILDKKFGISKWGVDLNNQQLIIYAYNIQNRDEMEKLQNKKIGNWTINIIEDTEIEMETNEVYTELKRMENTYDLQVAGVEIAPSEKKITMWVSNTTPDNQKLNGTQIKGWTVEVYLAGPPISPMTNLTNQS
jgi:hypothetical protein